MKRVLVLLFLFVTSAAFSQSNQLWRSFFSYNNIKDIAQSDQRVYAAAESSVFSKNALSNELKTITSVDGLKTDIVTAIYHSTEFSKTLVGNQNGLLLIINPDNSILTKIDILQEATVQPNKKKINHIYEHQGKAYISCDFGIAVLNLATMEFGDTYYLGPNGAEVPVLQSAVYNGMIWAVTPDNGLRTGLLSNPNLNDYSQWFESNGGSWQGVVTFNNILFAAQYGSVYKVSTGYQFLVSMPSAIIDMREANGYIVITSKDRVNVYNEQLALVLQLNNIPNEEVIFTCATVIGGRLFIGTEEDGLFSTPLDFISFDNVTPDGPIRNNIFSIEKSITDMWAVYGGYSFDYVPNGYTYGISRFTEQGWTYIPYEDIAAKNLGNVTGANDLSDIVVNPNNQKEVYVGSFHRGLLKILNGVPQEFFDHENTNSNGNEGLTSLIDPVPTYRSIRVNGLTYDRQGSLWMTNSRVPKPLKVLRGSKWESYTLEEAIGPSFFKEEYGKLVIDKNGTKWIPSLNNGVIAFNENQGPKILKIGEESAGNLPSPYVKSLAIDNNSQLWIGTTRGLRVLSGVDQFLTQDELTTRSIIIMEDGLAQELMYEQIINDIVVDGANNKWIGTAGAGAFLVSPDGQQTLFHFTRDNSPLPSNVINDIVIDGQTGEVFFATDKGMVSYQGTSTKAEENLNNVYVFPNPVRPEFYGDVNISGLMDQVNVKITDIEGNLVFETTSEGGTVLWNTTAFGKHRVASGVYMIFIASEDGTETKVKKVMIIR